MTTAEIIMDLVDSYGQAMREYTKKPTYGNQAPVGDAWEAIKAQVEKLHTEVSPVYMAVRRALADHEADKSQAIVEASNPVSGNGWKITHVSKRDSAGNELWEPASNPLECPHIGEVWEDAADTNLLDVKVIGFDGATVTFIVNGYEASNSLVLGMFQARYRRKQPTSPSVAQDMMTVRDQLKESPFVGEVYDGIPAGANPGCTILEVHPGRLVCQIDGFDTPQNVPLGHFRTRFRRKQPANI